MTTPVARPITASYPLCEESKHLLMPSRDKRPSHKVLFLPETWDIRTKHAPHPPQPQNISGTPCFDILQFSSCSCESSYARWALGWDERWRVHVSSRPTPRHMGWCVDPYLRGTSRLPRSPLDLWMVIHRLSRRWYLTQYGRHRPLSARSSSRPFGNRHRSSGYYL